MMIKSIKDVYTRNYSGNDKITDKRERIDTESYIKLYHEHTIEFENYVYKFLKTKNGIQKKKLWMVLIGQDLLYFADESKKELKKVKPLTGSFVREEIGRSSSDGEVYYSINIQSKNESKSLFFQNVDDLKICKRAIQKATGYRKFEEQYSILRRIGTGGFSTVYLAENTSNGQRVAVKIITKKQHSEKTLTSFIREIEILKFCNHENIIKYIDHFENSDQIFLIQEFVSGGDLSDYIELNGPLPESKIKSILRQIANGLGYLHKHCIIHRDIKPQNILISGNTVKICDFGLSKIIGENEIVNDSLGTLCFTSPEVITKKNYNCKVDVWSLGIIFYYLLYNNLPFIAREESEIAKLIVNGNFNIKSKIISESAKSLLTSCLEKEIIKRTSIPAFLNHDFLKV
jgi:serine/threonine protein kinase